MRLKECNASQVINLITLAILALSPCAFLMTASARPGPALTAELPGVSRGKLESYWLAPYVRVSGETVGREQGTHVTWFEVAGRINRQAEADFIQPGFISKSSRQLPEILTRGKSSTNILRRFEYRNVLQGVNEDWKIVLPSNDGLAGYVTSTADSRILVHEFHPQPGEIALDFYLHGRLVGKAGPFLQHGADGVQLSESGDAALTVWKDAARNMPRIVAMGTNGAVTFKADCEAGIFSPIAAPGANGVLTHPNGGATPNVFSWYTQGGKLRSVEVSPNPYCAGWVPGSHKSLFTTSNGQGKKYRMIDWDTGKNLWEMACPGAGEVMAIGFTGQLVIFAVAELYQPGPWRGGQWTLRNSGKEWTRAFYAVNVGDGRQVAKWRPSMPSQLWTDESDRFLRLGGKLYFITPGEVVELVEEEIIGKQNGWRPAPDPSAGK